VSSALCQQIAPSGAGDGVPAWEDVARHHGGFLYGVAFGLTRHRDDAEDLVQDALLRVRGGLERYEPGSLEGWLSRIVTNLFIDEMRRRNRRSLAPLPEDADHVLPPSPAAEETACSLSGDVWQALLDLPAEFRTPVVLCDARDLSYAQIAADTGLPIGTVRSRIHRGRRMLRAALTRRAA
jgi:RNA polymerase sigma-70 factor, ECF subfamily